jgi:sphingosine kinase
MAVDVLSILQSGRRSFSFLSQCVGLMADLDLGTEHLRWMGSSRFVYGYLRGSKYCPFVSARLPNETTFPSSNAQAVPVLNLYEN